MEIWWALVIIGGPLVLGLVLGLSKLRNKTSRADMQRTENATRDLYKDLADKPDPS
ncbi:MAG TPA: hypothetical protein VF637_18260 [Sphingomicrobium sp.]